MERERERETGGGCMGTFFFFLSFLEELHLC